MYINVDDVDDFDAVTLLCQVMYSDVLPRAEWEDAMQEVGWSIKVISFWVMEGRSTNTRSNTC